MKDKLAFSIIIPVYNEEENIFLLYLRIRYRIKRGAERLLQLLVEVACDLNGAILTIEGRKVPESYCDSFIKVGKAGIISVDLAQKLTSTSGLRNRMSTPPDSINSKHSYWVR